MVDMGKKIKEAALCLWELLGVLLDANLTRRCAAPKIKKTYVDNNVKEDLGMDLGEIGTEGAQQEDLERVENWADLDASDTESSGSEDEDDSEPSEVFSGVWNQFNPEIETAELDSDITDDEYDIHLPQCCKKQTRRCQKQDPAKRNAVLIAVVSLFLLHLLVQC